MKRLDQITPLRLLLTCLLFIAIGTNWAAGRSAVDYLHGGAAKYIQGRLQEASVEVEEGLRLFPNDSKLKALAGQLKSLKDQKKQDQSGEGSQGEQDSKPKEDKKDSSSQGNQQNKDQAKKDQEKKDQDKNQGKEKEQDKAKEKENEAKKQAEEGKNKDQNKPDSSGQAAAPVKPGELSKEEAERLLNSYQDDEKREHQEMQRRQKSPVGVEKDW